MKSNKTCSATTRAGQRCKRAPAEDSTYCYQHKQKLASQSGPASKPKLNLDSTTADLVNDDEYREKPSAATEPAMPDSAWQIIKIGAALLATYMGYKLLKRFVKKF